MAERPLIIFPEPNEVKRHKLPRVPIRLHIPLPSRQTQRLTPKFDSLRQSFERSRLQSDPAGAESEMVLVLETIGRIKDFLNTVGRIEGLEWLAAQDEDLIAPDDDFYYVNKKEEKLDKDLTGRLYLVMSNARGMQQLLSFWKRYKSHPDRKFDRPFGRLYEIFSCLKDIRPWGAEDRLRETGLLEDWQRRAEAGEERVRVEIELWYRENPELRSKIENELIGQVVNLDGKVLAKASIGEIEYHALLAELPVALVEDFRSNNDDVIDLLHCNPVMFFRPVGQIAGVIPYEESELESWQGGELPIPQDNPVVALLDGLPLENHNLLADHLIVDDPDDWASDYVVIERKHGTAMASLILHGELDAHDSILPSRIYVRPIMRPGPLNLQNERIERIPENILPVDIVHRAVRRIFEGDGTEPASAPTVRVINLSIADPARPLDRFPSSWARLLDWLSWEYKVLFVVSAGNHTRDIELPDVPREQFNSLRSNETLCQQTCKALNNDARHRRLLSPAESINALTVASVHSDNSEGAAYPGYVLDPLPTDTLAFPSPINAQGAGFRRSVKPDLLFPGGRQLYREEMSNSNANVVLKWLDTNRPPGQLVAFPRPGDPTAIGYTRGTSNAAALATRSAAIIYQNLQELFREAKDDGLGNDHVSVLIKALLVHSASWNGMSDTLTQCLGLEGSDRKNVCSRLLGYGRANVERVISCTDQRATLLGWGNIADDRAHQYFLPLPSSLNGRNEWRKITITLAWFSPINSDHQSYRRASLWFAPYGQKEARIFSMGLELQEDLENGNFSEQLRQQFTNNNIPLPQNVTIRVKKGQDTWVVYDEGESILYVIKKEDDNLNTYEVLKKAVDGAEYLLGVGRREADWQAVRRGTVQHEIFEGEEIKFFEEDAESVIQVNCRADAGKLVDEVPYALAVTLEVAPGIAIYEEIITRIRPRVRPPIL